ncbi:Midasin [Smittium mucronatum]|uniref:Midasin n=1 Tax=Smittium mucronatum TaxID=133383 RepID=A0A1R0H1Q7_9FUNG|nr:Midasin [Smittium mucronatum]
MFESNNLLSNSNFSNSVKDLDDLKFSSIIRDSDNVLQALATLYIVTKETTIQEPESNQDTSIIINQLFNLASSLEKIYNVKKIDSTTSNYVSVDNIFLKEHPESNYNLATIDSVPKQHETDYLIKVLFESLNSKFVLFNPIPLLDKIDDLKKNREVLNLVGSFSIFKILNPTGRKWDHDFLSSCIASIRRLKELFSFKPPIKKEILKLFFPKYFYYNVQDYPNITDPKIEGIGGFKREDLSATEVLQGPIFNSAMDISCTIRLSWILDILSHLLLNETNLSEIEDTIYTILDKYLLSLISLEADIIFYGNDILINRKFHSKEFNLQLFANLSEDSLIDNQVMVVSANNSGYFNSPSSLGLKDLVTNSSTEYIDWCWPLPSNNVDLEFQSINTQSIYYFMHIDEESPILAYSYTESLIKDFYAKLLYKVMDYGKYSHPGYNLKKENSLLPSYNSKHGHFNDLKLQYFISSMSDFYLSYINDFFKIYPFLVSSNSSVKDSEYMSSKMGYLDEHNQTESGVFQKSHYSLVSSMLKLKSFFSTEFRNSNEQCVNIRSIVSDFNSNCTMVYVEIEKSKFNNIDPKNTRLLFNEPNFGIIKKLVFIDSVSCFCESINLMISNLETGSCSNNFDLSANECKFALHKGSILLNMSIVLGLFPSQPVDPASKTQHLLDLNHIIMRNGSLEYVSSRMYNLLSAYNGNSKLTSDSEKIIIAQNKDFEETQKKSVYRSSNTQEWVGEGINQNMAMNSKDIDSNENFTFFELWSSFKKTLNGLLNIDRVAKILNDLSIMNKSLKSDCCGMDPNTLKYYRSYYQIKDHLENFDSSLQQSLESIMFKCGINFRDVTILWANRINNIRIGFKNVLLASNPFNLLPNSISGTMSKLLTKEIVEFPMKLVRISKLDLAESKYLDDTLIINNQCKDRQEIFLPIVTSNFLFKFSTRKSIKHVLNVSQSQKNEFSNLSKIKNSSPNNYKELGFDGGEHPLYLKYLLNLLKRISVSILLNQSMNRPLFVMLGKVYEEVCITWTRVEKLRKKQKEELGATYKIKSKSLFNSSEDVADISDEAKKLKEFNEWFPSYESHFELFQDQDSLNDDKINIIPNREDFENVGNSIIPSLNENILTEMFSIHNWIFKFYKINSYSSYQPTRCISPLNEFKHYKLSKPSSNEIKDINIENSFDINCPNSYIDLDSISNLLIDLLRENYQIASELGGRYFSLHKNSKVSETPESIDYSEFSPIQFDSYIDEYLSQSNVAILSEILNYTNASSSPPLSMLSGKKDKQKGSYATINHKDLGIGSKNGIKSLDEFRIEDKNNPLLSLLGINSEKLRLYDFYHHSNKKEAQILNSIVGPLLDRVEFLLSQYSDHSVLLQIKSISVNILSLKISTPIAKLLTGLETLLTKALDWENYNSSKDTSIQIQLDIITRQIINWRKLELYSWPLLVELEQYNRMNESHQYWFDLYSIIVKDKNFNIDKSIFSNNINQFSTNHPIFDVIHSFSKPNPQEISNIIGAADRFLQTCSVGEFSSRLKILKDLLKHRSFEFEFLAKTIFEQINSHSIPKNLDSNLQFLKISKEIMNDSISEILSNVISYYDQFSYSVNADINAFKETITKDLAQFVKISSFSDVNPISLKISAKNTHSHLSKCLRKWRDYLLTPTNSVIEKHIKSNSMIATTNSKDSSYNINSNIPHFISFKNSLEEFSYIGVSNSQFNQCLNCYNLSLSYQLKTNILNFKKFEKYAPAFELIYSILGLSSPELDSKGENSYILKIKSLFSDKKYDQFVSFLEYLKNYWNFKKWSALTYIEKSELTLSKGSSNLDGLTMLNVPKRLFTYHNETISYSDDITKLDQFIDFEKWFSVRNRKLTSSFAKDNYMKNFWKTPFPNPITVSSIISPNNLDLFFSSIFESFASVKKLDFEFSFDKSTLKCLLVDNLEIYISTLSEHVSYFQTLSTPTELLNKAENILLEFEKKKSYDESQKLKGEKHFKSKSAQNNFTRTKGTIKVKSLMVSNDSHQENTEKGEISSKEALEIQKKSIRSFWSQQKQLRQKIIIDTIKQLKRIGLNPNTKAEIINSKVAQNISYDLSNEIENISLLKSEEYIKSIHEISSNNEDFILKSTHASLCLLSQSDSEYFEQLTFLNQAFRSAYYLDSSKQSAESINGRNEINQQQIDRLFGLSLSWNNIVKKGRRTTKNLIDDMTNFNKIISLFVPINGFERQVIAQNTIFSVSTGNTHSKIDNDEIILDFETKKSSLDSIVAVLLQSISSLKLVISSLSKVGFTKDHGFLENSYFSRDDSSGTYEISSEKSLENTSFISYNKNELESAFEVLSSLLAKTQNNQLLINSANYRFSLQCKLTNISPLSGFGILLSELNCDWSDLFKQPFSGFCGVSSMLIDWESYFQDLLINLNSIINSCPGIKNFIVPIIETVMSENSKSRLIMNNSELEKNSQNNSLKGSQDHTTNIDLHPFSSDIMMTLNPQDHMGKAIDMISNLGNAITISLQQIYKTFEKFDGKTSVMTSYFTHFSLSHGEDLSHIKNISSDLTEVYGLDNWDLYSDEIKIRSEFFEDLSKSTNVAYISRCISDICNEMGLAFGAIFNNACKKKNEVENPISSSNLEIKSTPLEYLLFLISKRLTPLIKQYHYTVQHIFNSLIQQNYQITKCSRIFSQLITSIFNRGLASPDALSNIEDFVDSDDKDVDDSGNNKNREFDTTDASGMGEGSTEGAKNVSDEIENEDQVLGANQKDKDENQNQDEKKPSRNEESIEMETDFDGEIGEADLEDNNDSDDSLSDTNDDIMDEQLGNVDLSDPTAIDEKMWADDDGSDSKDPSKSEKAEKQISGSAEKGNIDQEMVAKEDLDDGIDPNNNKGNEPETDSKNNKEFPDKNEKASKDPLHNEQDDDQPDTDSQDGEEQDDHQSHDPNGLGASLPIADVENDISEQMDLPDDLNLDKGKNDDNEGEDLGYDDDESPINDPLDRPKNQENGEEDSHNPDSEAVENDLENGDDKMDVSDSAQKDKDDSIEGGNMDEQMELDEDDIEQDPQDKSTENINERPSNIEEIDIEDEKNSPTNNSLDEDNEDDPKNIENSADNNHSLQEDNINDTAQVFGSGTDLGHNEENDSHNSKKPNTENSNSNTKDLTTPNDSKDSTELENRNQSVDDDDSEKNNYNNGKDNSGNQLSTLSLDQQVQDLNLNEMDNSGKLEPKNIESELEQKNNPLRSLADTMENWEQRLNIVEREMDSIDKTSGQSEDNLNAPQLNDSSLQYQHVGEDEVSHNTAMAGTDEEVSKNQLRSLDEKNDDQAEVGQSKIREEKNYQEDSISEPKQLNEISDDTKENISPTHNESSKSSESKNTNLSELSRIIEELNKSSSKDVDKENKNEAKLAEIQSAITNKSENENVLHTMNFQRMSSANETSDDTPQSSIDLDQNMGDDIKITDGDSSDSFNLDDLNTELELATKNWNSLQNNKNDYMTIWNGFIISSQENSMRLCEQLRLILEPTQSSHLRGDYRTGKRLNMKRIIPYIASQYKKDKIWLRRTKPMKRQYQVMLAIDDSKSMISLHGNQSSHHDPHNSNTVKLTFETLALLTNSLQLLEVGDLSVVSFGDDVKLLQPFGNQIDLENGARIISQLKFDNETTDIKMLLSTATSMFDSDLINGSSNKNQELWKLMIILSDGICQNHSEIKQLVRNATEMRIMIVFVVLDRVDSKSETPEKPNNTSSITEIKQVQYVTNSLGRVELQMSKYLDTFPFDFYVVLRDINGLPEVLSDALRQFFALVSSDS